MNCPHCTTPLLEHPAGRCLDTWIAEAVMGWTWNDIAAWSPSGGKWDTNREGWMPSYSTDTAAAFLVVEKFKGTGFGVGVWIMDRFTEAWMVQEPWKVRADTFPHAVCLAAIKAHHLSASVTD